MSGETDHRHHTAAVSRCFLPKSVETVKICADDRKIVHLSVFARPVFFSLYKPSSTTRPTSIFFILFICFSIDNLNFKNIFTN